MIKPPSHDSCVAMLGVKDVALRELEVENPRIIDVSQNYSRAKLSKLGVCPCVSPRGIFFHIGCMRRLFPTEFLYLQNTWYEFWFPQAAEKMDQLNDSTIQKLAGNALNTNCCGALFLATMVGLSRCKERKFTKSNIAASSSLGDVPEPESRDIEKDSEARQALLVALDSSSDGEQ